MRIFYEDSSYDASCSNIKSGRRKLITDLRMKKEHRGSENYASGLVFDFLVFLMLMANWIDSIYCT